MSEIMMKKDLLAAVTSIISDTDSSIRYVGPKPWYERTLNKLKKGLFATAVLGVAAFGISSVDSQTINGVQEKVISTFHSVKSDTSKQFNDFSINKVEQKVQTKLNNMEESTVKIAKNIVKSGEFKSFIKISNELPQKIKSIINIEKNIKMTTDLNDDIADISVKKLIKEVNLSNQTIKIDTPKIQTVAFVESLNKGINPINKLDNSSTTKLNSIETSNSNGFKYFFTLASSTLSSLKIFNQNSIESNNINQINLTALNKQKVEGSSNLVTETEVVEKIKVLTEVDRMKVKYPSVKFDNLETQRDVSKEFFGVNNFIALAAEMEGFRGDLHKDPAVGLNIGFGYNITKRVYASQSDVEADLKAIGIDDIEVQNLIKLSKTPQSKLAKAIKEYNKTAQLEKNQLISMAQGVALLHRTEYQYRADAANVFNTTWEKKGTNEKEVLTYAAYKAGGEALSKYKQAIKASEYVYKKKSQTPDDLKMIAKHLMFYYKKDGGEYVLDTRASLIAQTFVNPEFLAIQIGKKDVVKTNAKKLNQQRLDFSHLPLSKDTLNTKAEQHASADYSNIGFNPENMRKTLENVRETQKKSPTFVRMG